MFRMPHHSPIPPNTSLVAARPWSYTPHPPAAKPSKLSAENEVRNIAPVHGSPLSSPQGNTAEDVAVVCDHILQLFDQADYARVVRYATKAALILEDDGTARIVNTVPIWDMAWRVAASLCLVGAWDDALCVIGLYRTLCGGGVGTASSSGGIVRPDAMEAGIEFLRADENTSTLSNREMLGIVGLGSHKKISSGATEDICTQTSTDYTPNTTTPSPIEVVQRVISWLDESGLQQSPVYTLTVDTSADPHTCIGEYYGRPLLEGAIPSPSTSPTRHSVPFADEDDVCWSPRDHPARTTPTANAPIRPPSLPLLLTADIKMEIMGSEVEDVGRRGVSADAIGMYIESTCKSLLDHDGAASPLFAVELHTRALVVLLMRTVLRQRAYSVPLPKLFISYMLGSWEEDGGTLPSQHLPMKELVDAAYLSDSEATLSITNLTNVSDADWNSSALQDLLIEDNHHHNSRNNTAVLPTREEYMRRKLWDVVWGRYGGVLDGMRRAAWACVTTSPLTLVSSSEQLQKVLREKLHSFCCAADEGVDGIEVLQYLDFTTSGTWKGSDSTPSALRTWISTASPRLVQGFLLLTTGLTCLPTNTGLVSPIHVVRDDTRLFARTCFYELLLPEYRTFGDLADSIEMACSESLARHASMGNMGES